jgi:hemerythrin-like domain-containing protein
LRDATDDGLFSRIKRVLPRIEEKMEVQRQQRQEQTGDNGQHEESFCTIHQVEMKRSKDGNGFYHKSGEKPDGKAIWCRGK